MYRCIVDSPVAVLCDGIHHVIRKGMDDLPDGHPLVAAAPWAFESLQPKPRRGRPPKSEQSVS